MQITKNNVHNNLQHKMLTITVWISEQLWKIGNYKLEICLAKHYIVILTFPTRYFICNYWLWLKITQNQNKRKFKFAALNFDLTESEILHRYAAGNWIYFTFPEILQMPLQFCKFASFFIIIFRKKQIKNVSFSHFYYGLIHLKLHD